MNTYAIVGGGRLARHFSEYFRLLAIPHTCWTRDRHSSFNTHSVPDADRRLRLCISNADRVLTLVSDDVISSLLNKYSFLYEKQLIHCSGTLSIPGVACAHPLMTFVDDLYDIETYKSVPFMLESGCSFTELFPDLPNPSFVINVEDKARYHALCVMAGNFPQLLWQGVAERFEHQFELPASILGPYLKQLMANFIESPNSALTGPLIRDDQQTIERNIASLDGDGLQDLYQAFVCFYQHSQWQSMIQGQTPLEQRE